jgi:20S proteasome alpha/beta subunit
MSHIQRNHLSLIGNRRRSFSSSSAMIIKTIVSSLSCCILFFSLSTTTTTTTTLLLVEASSAAGSETLIGIVGKDFILLGADSSVSQSIALTASNLDKITPLVDPFPNNGNGDDGDDLRRQKTKVKITTSGSVPETVSFVTKSKIQRRRRRRQQTIVAAAAGDAADSDKVLSILKAYGTYIIILKY